MSMSKFVCAMEDHDVLAALEQRFSEEGAFQLKQHLEGVADCQNDRTFLFDMDSIVSEFAEYDFKQFLYNYEDYPQVEDAIPEGFNRETATPEEAEAVARAVADKLSDHTTVLYLPDGFIVDLVW